MCVLKRAPIHTCLFVVVVVFYFQPAEATAYYPPPPPLIIEMVTSLPRAETQFGVIVVKYSFSVIKPAVLMKGNRADTMTHDDQD